jgi:hypothetical protein
MIAFPGASFLFGCSIHSSISARRHHDASFGSQTPCERRGAPVARPCQPIARAWPSSCPTETISWGRAWRWRWWRRRRIRWWCRRSRRRVSGRRVPRRRLSRWRVWRVSSMGQSHEWKHLLQHPELHQPICELRLREWRWRQLGGRLEVQLRRRLCRR